MFYYSTFEMAMHILAQTRHSLDDKRSAVELSNGCLTDADADL